MKTPSVPPSIPPHVSYLLSGASLVLLIGGIKLAQAFVVPVLLAMFLAIILFPMQAWLQKRGISPAVALLVVIVGVALAGVGVIAVVGASVTDFSLHVGDYRVRLGKEMDALNGWLEERFGALFGGGESPVIAFGSEQAIQMLRSVFRDVGGLLGSTVIILILVIFMLLEAAVMPLKLEIALGKADPWNDRVLRIADDVRRYMVIKTWTSLLTGVLVTIMLVIMRVDYPIMWGLIAFLFNYVPNIGSIIAAVPAVLLALLQYGLGPAFVVAFWYVAINCAISYAVEPRFMGRGLGLSPLVVILSLLFWGWVLGPVGMFLSAPLTMIVKIVLEADPKTHWLAVLLGHRLPRRTVRS